VTLISSTPPLETTESAATGGPGPVTSGTGATWPDGQEGGDGGRDRMPRAAKVLVGALLLISAASVAGGTWLAVDRPSSGLALAALVTGTFFFLAAVVVPQGVTREMRLEHDEAINCADDCQRLHDALPDDSEQGLQQTLKNLTVANFKQMRTFAAIAQRQARMSYYASLLGAGLSLLVLLAGAAAAIGLPSVPGKVAAGSLAVVGTAFSGFLSKTFLRTYDMSLRQMSYYYGQPLVHCYLYHAEWLTMLAPREVGAQDKSKLYQQVVQASIDASVNAQNHLLSLHQHDPWGRRGAFLRRRSPLARPVPPHMVRTVTDDAIFAAFRRPY
jgi:hypothetical protein